MFCAITLQAQSDGKSDLEAAGDGSASIGGALHLVRYQGVIPEVAGAPRANVAGVTFSLYDEQNSGTPLWMETQNVQVDEQGHYTALLGATKTEGVPPELFAAGQAQWLGVQISGQLGETRTVLGSVPYAVQAGDAESLGGRPAEEFMLAGEVHEQVRNELRLAGFDIPETGSSGGRFRAQDHRDDHPDPGSNANDRAITNEDLNVKLDLILAILNEPETVFSWPLCAEVSGNYEVAGSTEANVKLGAEGRIGAEGYGNGLMVRLLGTPGGKIETAWKFALGVPKTGPCVDLAAIVRNGINRASAVRPASVAAASAGSNVALQNSALLDKIQSLDEEEMTNRLLALADTLQVDPATLQNLLDRLADFSFDGGPLASLRGNDEPDRAALMEALPIPPNVKAVLTDPSSLLEKFKEIKETGICNLSPRPPVLDGPLGEICELAANERFSKLLDRVDDVTGAIQTRVNTINTRVLGIVNRLPTQDSCKLFCDKWLNR